MREAPRIGYVLKGFPRLSELFIASEIHRLEQSGIRLSLLVIKRDDEPMRHRLVDRIHAQPHYLPPTESVSGQPLHRWLARHVPRFAPHCRRVARRWPAGVARATAAALGQSLRARARVWDAPRKVYVKELLQAIALADRLIGEPEVRHLHAHFCHGATTVAWLAATITGLPFSFTAHAKDLYCSALNPAGLLRRKRAAARCAVTCTDTNRRYLNQFAGATPVYCVYHGPNAEFPELLRREVAPPQERGGDLHVLGVGRLVHKKGFDVLVDACAQLAARGIPATATIVGEAGDLSADLERRIRAHRLEGRIRLAGPMDQAALYREYRNASVFCLPCRVRDDGDRDGIPNVLLEAMASGVPVVTTPVSGIPELVTDGRSGLLVPPNDSGAIADALLRVHRSPGLARRLAAEGGAIVRDRFDGDRLAGELVAIFAKAVA